MTVVVMVLRLVVSVNHIFLLLFLKSRPKKSPVGVDGAFLHWFFLYGTNQPRLLKRDDGG